MVRTELDVLLRELALPTIFITHDFRDAATLADRAAVIIAGSLRQVGPVEQLARHPTDSFVAALTGNNVLAANATPLGTGSLLTLDDGQTLRAPVPRAGRVGVVVAPWDVRLAPGPRAGVEANLLRGRVGGLARQGSRFELRVGALAVECPADDPATSALEVGAEAWVEVPPEAILLVDGDPDRLRS